MQFLQQKMLGKKYLRNLVELEIIVMFIRKQLLGIHVL